MNGGDSPALPAAGNVAALQTALAAAQSGQTVTAEEGTYAGDFTVPAGVTLQAATGAQVVIDITTTFDMRGATVKDLELMSTNTNRYVVQTGINMSAPDSHLIGCDVHDIHANGAAWFGGGPGEISECLFYNNGYYDDQAVGAGHCVYSHNHGGGTCLIDNNIMFHGLGRYLIHVYSSGENYLQDYTVSRNITARKPNIVGGGLGVSNLLYEDNVQWDGHCAIGLYSPPGANVDCIVRDNLFGTGAELAVTDFQTQTVENNLTVTDAQAVIYPCTKSARKLAHIAIFNPASAATFSLDLSSLALANGDYVLRNAQKPAETHAFTYTGAVVAVPMTGWHVAHRIGGGAYIGTFPQFGVFVLEAAS